MSKNIGIILAAGEGLRIGAGRPKQFLKINAFSRQKFLQTFPRLKDINIFDNEQFPLHEKFILWVSTHLWYRGAMIMAQGVQKWQEIKKYGFRK